MGSDILQLQLARTIFTIKQPLFHFNLFKKTDLSYPFRVYNCFALSIVILQ